jgi:urease accessory protein
MGRFLAKDPAALRADLVRFLLIVTKGGLPRVWTAGSDVSIRRGAITVDGGAPSMPDWEDAVRKEAEVEPDPA